MNEHTAALMAKLDGRGSDDEWTAVRTLRLELGAGFAGELLAAYKTAKSWRHRTSYVYHAMSVCTESNDAIALGELALFDKSKVVRYRACMLLAIAQRVSALPVLDEALSRGLDSADDYRAAIDAIRHRNPNYFVDRDHSGQVTLGVGRT